MQKIVARSPSSSARPVVAFSVPLRAYSDAVEQHHLSCWCLCHHGPLGCFFPTAEGKRSLLPLYPVVLIVTASSHKTYLCHEVIYESTKLPVRPSCMMKWKMFSLLAALADSTIIYIYFSLC